MYGCMQCGFKNINLLPFKRNYTSQHPLLLSDAHTNDRLMYGR